jgi:hypothetical protein
MKKSILISGLVGAVVFYLLNMLFYAFSGVMDAYATDGGAAISRGENPLHIHLILGHLVMGIFLAQIYSKWTRGTHSFSQGAQLGALLGVVFGVGLNLIWFATSSFMTSTGHIIDAAWQIIALGITCGVIAIVMNKVDGGS